MKIFVGTLVLALSLFTVQSCPIEEQVPCGNKKVYVCHFNQGAKEFNELCLSQAGARNHLANHPQDKCGPCGEQVDPTKKQDVGPVTYPFVELQAPLSRYSFNPMTVPLCVVLQNAEFDGSTVSLSVNGLSLDPVINSTSACVDPFTFSEGSSIVLFSAMTLPIVLSEDMTGPVPLELSTAIEAGSRTVTVNLVNENGALFTDETNVTAKLSDDPLVSSTLSTITGSVTFTNLPPRTITFTAQGPNSEVGTKGAIAGMTSSVTLVLFGFNDVSLIDNKDFSEGTLDGWVVPIEAAASIVEHVENVGPSNTNGQRRRLQLDNNDLVLDTIGVEGEQKASYTFPTSDDACYIRLRYRFVTSEVPGGYFGSQYNDYFAVSVRSEDAEDSVIESGTMNGLGLAAFDANGATNWREAGLKIEPGFFVNDNVQVDLVVANVGDGLFQSQVYLDFIEEILKDDDAAEDECACAACDSFFKQEIKDTGWINNLPLCPCAITTGVLPCSVRPVGSTLATGTLGGVNWMTDKAMNTCCDLGCHPGAAACIRGAGPGGTTQQCCYDGTGNLLLHGAAGAGTPDRNFPDHDGGDVDPYLDCCIRCPSKCSQYIGKPNGTQGARSDPRSTTALCPVANRVNNALGGSDVCFIDYC